MTLKEYLEANSLKPAHLAKRAGIAPCLLTKYLVYGRQMSPRTARKIEEATGGKVSIHALLFR